MNSPDGLQKILTGYNHPPQSEGCQVIPLSLSIFPYAIAVISLRYSDRATKNPSPYIDLNVGYPPSRYDAKASRVNRPTAIRNPTEVITLIVCTNKNGIIRVVK